MAGIGFTLQRALKSGRLSSFVSVAFSGIMIVAGPWLLSMIGLNLVTRFSLFLEVERRALFQGIVIYSFAFSLSLYGGLHFIFTRMLADALYEKKNEEAGALLTLFLLISLLLSVLLATLPVNSIQNGGIKYPFMFKASAVLFFITINCIWFLMIGISLLKKFLHILLAFFAGQFVAISGFFFLGKSYGLGGVMLGFTSGYVLIFLLLGFFVSQSYPVKIELYLIKKFLHYFSRYIPLFLTGIFYNLGIWSDNMVYWFFKGSQIEGTFIKIFQPYDVVIYIAMLTMIPGLVYFVVFSETNVFIYLQKFLNSLGRNSYLKIQEKKYHLVRILKKELIEQAHFQGVFTFIFLVLSPWMFDLLLGRLTSLLVLRISLVGVFFNLLLLALVTYLFYFEMYLFSFYACFSFFTINFLLSILTAISNLIPYGLSYLIGALLGCVAAGFFLFTRTKRFDRRILSG